MRILVDEDSQARAQLNLLRTDGHDVVATDFYALHRERPGHRGIVAVYRDADPGKNMNHAQIVAAIRRLELSSVTIAGHFHVLNHWR